MSASTPAPAVPASSVVGAVMFSDLVGFTEFNGVRGDAAAVEVLDRHREMMDAAVVDVDARVVKELGDGLLVWSGSADVGMGVAAAFMSSVVDARANDAFPLAARVGVHHGRVMIRGDDIVGQTVNMAARIVDLAGPGEILVSDAVLDACEADERLACRPIGPAMVRGVAEAVWLHRVEC